MAFFSQFDQSELLIHLSLFLTLGMYFFPGIIINQFHASDLFLHLLKT